MKRGGPLKAGKKTLAKREAMRFALDSYFEKFGDGDLSIEPMAPCQYTGVYIFKSQAVPHHKTPRSELRKAGFTDLDAPHRLLIVSHDAHGKIHGWSMGRPKNEAAALEFSFVESHPANAENGRVIERLP